MTPRSSINRSEAAWLAAIVGVALAVRIYPAWPRVFLDTHLNLLENDAAYHLRVIENLVAQFPHRLVTDPYAVTGGMYVAVAPLFDLLVATAAWVAGLGHPSADTVGRIAVFTPPLLGAATVALVYAAARRIAGSLGGLMAAALAALLPGHFLERTLLGYVDHHALEAALSTGVFYLVLRSLDGDGGGRRTAAALGAVLVAYLLTWTSAPFLLGILTVWLVLHGLLHAWRHIEIGAAGRIAATAAGMALVSVVLLRSINPYQFVLQVTAAIALLVVGVSLEIGRLGIQANRWSSRTFVGAACALLGTAAVAAVIAFPVAAGYLVEELTRFTPGPRTIQVLEARPLFLYGGSFSWRPSWELFGPGFWAGLAALGYTGMTWIRSGTPAGLLLVVWTGAMFLATLAQNRFGYYLVPAVAVAAGCVSARAIEASLRAGGWRPTVTVACVAGLLFGPSIMPSLRAAGRAGGLPSSWVPAFEWLRQETPEPFGDPAYYYARYNAEALRAPDTSVMLWWDYGYWLLQQAHRVPVTNPTQTGARLAGRFFAETDERRALTQLAAARARYVLVDELLPITAQTAAAGLGKFPSMALYAELPSRRFFDPFLLPEGSTVRPVILYYPEYFQTMTFRLGVLGGEGSTGSPALVVSWTMTAPPGGGGTARVITSLQRFATADAAHAEVRRRGAGNNRVVSEDPRRSPVPLEPVTGLRRVFRTPAPGVFGQGAVQVFEVAR